jgi:hypothetical protein
MTTNNNFRVKNGLEVNGPVDVKNNNLNDVYNINMSQTPGGKSINGAEQINLGGNYPGAGGDVQINKQGSGGNFRLRVEGQNVLQMNTTDAVFYKPLNVNAQLTIQSPEGLKFSDNTVQTTAAAPFTGTAPLLKATEQLTVGTVRILENEAGELAILPAASFADIIDTQFEFNGTTGVIDEVTQATVSSTRSQATFDSVQVPLAGLTSWFNTTGGQGQNYIFADSGYDFSSMTNSPNWTIDMWIRPESSGSGAGNQMLVNGSGFGDGPNNIFFSVDNGVPNNGSLRLGNGNNQYMGPNVTSGAWHHVGVMRKDGVMYWLLDGSATPVQDNPTINFGARLQFLGATFGGTDDFALGYASGIRVSLDTALFTSGNYTQPEAADYILDTVAAEPVTINVGAIKFADDTVMSTAPTGGASYDQSLNTTDSVTFASFKNATAPGGVATSFVPDIYGINFNSNGQQAARLTADGFLGAILQLPKVVGGDQELVLMTKHTYGKTGRIQLLGNSWGIPGEPVEVNIQTYAVSNNTTVNIAKFKEDEVIFNLPTRLTPLAAAPATPAAGMMAVSDGIGWDPATDGDEHLNIYLNGAWVQIA